MALIERAKFILFLAKFIKTLPLGPHLLTAFYNIKGKGLSPPESGRVEKFNSVVGLLTYRL